MIECISFIEHGTIALHGSWILILKKYESTQVKITKLRRQSALTLSTSVSLHPLEMVGEHSLFGRRRRIKGMGKEEGWAGQENKGMGRRKEREGSKRYFHDKCSCFPYFSFSSALQLRWHWARLEQAPSVVGKALSTIAYLFSLYSGTGTEFAKMGDYIHETFLTFHSIIVTALGLGSGFWKTVYPVFKLSKTRVKTGFRSKIPGF